jgi:hypothetical protein
MDKKGNNFFSTQEKTREKRVEDRTGKDTG